MSEKFTTEDDQFLEEGLSPEGLEEIDESETNSIFDDLDEIDFEALGIDPKAPTVAKPGSERKVLTLAARYAAGLPLWDSSDRYDHAPGQANFPGLKFDA